MKKTKLPLARPVCCGLNMYPCGGVIGSKGDEEHFWRCDKCKKETIDVKVEVYEA